MDDTLVLVALAPFYALSVVAVSYTAMYAYHVAKRLGDSAQEQQLTEQLPGKVA